MNKKIWCRKCDSLMSWDSHFHAYVCRQCGNRKEVQPTNLDRMHNMNAEQMADEVYLNVPSYDDMKYVCGSWRTKQEFVEWLNSPAEVGDSNT